MNAIEPDALDKQSAPEGRRSRVRQLGYKILRLGQKNPETGFSGWLVIFSAFLCLLTGINVWILHNTDRTLYEQATGRDRGWILLDVAITGGKFLNPSDPIELRLIHRNIGSAAVTQLTTFYKVSSPVTRANKNLKWEDVLRTKNFPLENFKCTGHSLPTILPATSNLPPILRKGEANSDGTLTPSESTSTSVGFISLQDNEVPKQGDVWWGNPFSQDLMDEKLKTTLVIYGCSEYWSIKAGRTNFCRYLDTNDRLEPKDWQFKECPTGNKLE